jgi:hypothetical protein
MVDYGAGFWVGRFSLAILVMIFMGCCQSWLLMNFGWFRCAVGGFVFGYTGWLKEDEVLGFLYFGYGEREEK